MGLLESIDAFYDKVDDLVDASGRLLDRNQRSAARVERMRDDRERVVDGTVEIVDAPPSSAKSVAIVPTTRAPFYLARREDGSWVVTNGRNVSTTCPSRVHAEQLLELLRETEGTR